jgi:competence protein ComEA
MFRKFLKDYFTFTRSERNGLFVLIIFIFILIVVRLIIPHIRQNKTYDFSEFQDEINEFEKSVSEVKENPEGTEITPKNSELFFFDPNTAKQEELLNLGLKPGVVKNILKYRDHGGNFRVNKDLKKIYGLDSADYIRIEPYILITASKDPSFKLQSEDSIKMYPYVGYDKTDSFQPLPLNISDSATLTGIYGIGPVLSVRIIKYRNLLGGYVSTEQLREVYGMTEENFEHIRNAIYIDTAAITPININAADFTGLSRHPYLTDYQARAIISYREINGKFINTNEIEKNNLLPQDIYLKIKPYLTVE